jgi:predicted  nucleic acid-binding Zn-ribbon protein
LIAGAGGLAGVAAIVDGIRRRKKLTVEQGQAVANSAVALVERLERRANHLEDQLDQANQRTETLTKSLREANDRAENLQRQHDELAGSLADAQLEIRHLRLLTKSLTDELDRRGGPMDRPPSL